MSRYIVFILSIAVLLCGGGSSYAASPVAASEIAESCDPYKSGVKCDWAELPTYSKGDSYTYLTHFAAVEGRSMRNYSYCFDATKRAAHWVAYPYHKIYDGAVKRRDKFIYDPKLSSVIQADLKKSYFGDYDRGHQLPSADRDATQLMNDQTFYSSNMTPQMATLNRHLWASIERDVRKQVCADTLFIVSGADFSREIGVTTDVNGEKCPIPAAYYKVLLRTRKGDSGKKVAQAKASELQTIGLWVEHVAGAKLQYISVEEIERRVGFVFFPDIPQEAKQAFNKEYWVF